MLVLTSNVSKVLLKNSQVFFLHALFCLFVKEKKKNKCKKMQQLCWNHWSSSTITTNLCILISRLVVHRNSIARAYQILNCSEFAVLTVSFESPQWYETLVRGLPTHSSGSHAEVFRWTGGGWRDRWTTWEICRPVWWKNKTKKNWRGVMTETWLETEIEVVFWRAGPVDLKNFTQFPN